MTLGHSYEVFNNSTGAVTINSSGGNAVVVLSTDQAAIVTCILASGTTASSWDFRIIQKTYGGGGSFSWGATASGTSGTGLALTIGNSTAASTIGQSVTISNTQTNAATGISVDTGTSAVAHTGISITNGNASASAAGLRITNNGN